MMGQEQELSLSPFQSLPWRSLLLVSVLRGRHWGGAGRGLEQRGGLGGLEQRGGLGGLDQTLHGVGVEEALVLVLGADHVAVGVVHFYGGH